MPTKSKSPFVEAIRSDNTVAISSTAKDLWLADIENPLRWHVLPFLKFIFTLLLQIIWFVKRLPIAQFSAHGLLQAVICWFCKHFVSYEANILILRHFSTESNLLNFIIANSETSTTVEPVSLYPLRIEDMMRDSFVKHDQELFRIFSDLVDSKFGKSTISWDNWRNVDQLDFNVKYHKTQILDFETSHVLFMCLFCFLLTAEEYRDAINGFNLDQSIAIRIERLVNEKGFSELAYNKHPLFLVGPWNLNQRFLMHGFFTEHLNAQLQEIKEGESND